MAAQQFGWSRVGHALAIVAVPVGRAVWLAVKVGWPVLLAVVISLLLGIGSRERLAGVATRVRQRTAERRWIAIVAVVVGVVGLLVVVLVAAPPWFVHNRSLEGLKAQNEVRTTLLQGLGGVVLLVGAYFTYRQVLNSREQLAHSREQLQIAQQGQITERFTRAMDQLGHAQPDVRLGGIYALERIARDSSADRVTIGEVLTAFVRGHAPVPPDLLGEDVIATVPDWVPELQVRAPDVQASLTVLGRGGFARPKGQGDRLDLHAVDLRRAHLGGAHLERADFRGAHLEGARLENAHLEGARLSDAHLEGASLTRAHLEGASLDDAHLEGARLYYAHLEDTFLLMAHLERAVLAEAYLQGAVLDGARLEHASLRRAHLEQASLVGANLEGAHLSGINLERADLHAANLQGAVLDGANLQGAVADEHTSWPAGFDWRAAGVITDDEDAAASPPEQA
jgi:uncharacterized protein YjbI with pentapeptide repeats